MSWKDFVRDFVTQKWSHWMIIETDDKSFFLENDHGM